MNFFNEIKYVDLDASCLGALDMDQFKELIKGITDKGGTYRFIVLHKGRTLTKKGIPFDSVLFTIRDNALHLAESEDLSPKSSPEIDANIKELSSFIGTADNRFSEEETRDLLKSANVILLDDFMFLDLQIKLETMIQESDYLNNLYLDKNITRDNLFKDRSLWFDLENISLAYFKSSL
jgi:hypothetical protein